MKNSITFLALLIFGFMLNQANAQSTGSDNAVSVFKPVTSVDATFEIPKTGVYFYDSKSTLLYDNGPLVNFPGIAPGDADTSRLESALGLTLYGTGHQLLNLNRVADDLVVPVDWTIDSLVFFAYQTGSSLTSTFNHYNVRVWDDSPAISGSNVIWGDTTTNRLTRTAFSNIYRNIDTDPGNTQRPIMRNVVATPGLYLPAGTYYIDWQAGGSLASGPWCPPITITGTTTTGNGLQKQAGLPFAAALSGTYPQGFPFIVYGVTGIPAPVHDVGVVALTAPVDGTLTATETITITIENFNTNSESGIPVSYKLDGGTTVTETFAGPIASLSTDDYTFTATGNFSALGYHTFVAWTALSTDSIHTNDTTYVTVNNTAGIGENSDVPQVIVYPNPANDFIRVNCSKDIQILELFDQTGRLIYTAEPLRTENYIPVSGLQQGIYTLRILSDSETVWKKIVIK